MRGRRVARARRRRRPRPGAGRGPRTRAADRPAAPPPTTDDVVGASVGVRVVRSRSCPERRRTGQLGQRLLLFPGTGRGRNGADDRRAGTRLDRQRSSWSVRGCGRVREQRGLTLTEVAAARRASRRARCRGWRTGSARPSLELLLPLAQIYRVPLDDLVGAPEVGDPRIRLKPRRVNGRTVLPLTRPGRHPGVEDRHPADAVEAEAPHPRRVRVALRAARADAADPGRPGPGARGRGGGRVRHPGAALVRQHRATDRPRC